MSRVKIFSIILSLIIVGSGLYVLTQWRRPLDKVVMVEQNADKTENKIFYWEKVPLTVNQGQDITLYILANSKNKDVTGYDLVIDYSRDSLLFSRAESVADSFDIYPTNNKLSGETTITAVKKISMQSPVRLNNDKVIGLSFKALRKGEHTIRLSTGNGRVKTKLVDTNSNVTYQNVEDSIRVNAQ